MRLPHSTLAMATLWAPVALMGCADGDAGPPSHGGSAGVHTAGATGDAGEGAQGGSVAGGRGGTHGGGTGGSNAGTNASGATSSGGMQTGGEGAAAENGGTSAGDDSVTPGVGGTAGAHTQGGAAGFAAAFGGEGGEAGDSGAAGAVESGGTASGAGGTGMGGTNAGSGGTIGETTGGMGGTTGGMGGTTGGMGGTTGGMGGTTGGMGGMGGSGGACGGSRCDCVLVAPDGDDAAALASGGVEPFRNVQPALDFADLHRDGPLEVCVAQGPTCEGTASYPGPASADLRMHDGLSVTGGYESTTWTTCSNSAVTLAPNTERGVYFGPDVQSATALSRVSVRPFTALSTAAVTFDGARGATVDRVELALPDAPVGTLYGFDAKNGANASATMISAARGELQAEHLVAVRAVGSRITFAGGITIVAPAAVDLVGAWLERADGSAISSSFFFYSPASGIGVHAEDTSNLVLDHTSVRFGYEVGPSVFAVGAELSNVPNVSWSGGNVSMVVAATDHAVLLENSPHAKLDLDVDLSTVAGTADAVRVTGDVTGTSLMGTVRTRGPQPTGIVLDACTGEHQAVAADVEVAASATYGVGIQVSGDCAPSISSDVTVTSPGTHQPQTLTGIECAGATRCAIEDSTVRIVGASTTPGAVITANGVNCDVGNCVSIRNSRVSGLSQPGELRNSLYYGGGVIAPGSSLVSGNLISAGCSGGSGIGLVASGRIENNVISGPGCGGSYLGAPTATGLAAGGNVDIHSNTIFAGGAFDAAAFGQTTCTSVGLSLGNGVASVRNNIIEDGCSPSYAVRRGDGMLMSVLANNDIRGRYLDGATPVTDIQGINALPGASLNFSADPVLDGSGHVLNSSPCIDAGTSAGAPAEDIDGDARDQAPDVGADEWVGEPPPNPCAGVDCSGHGTCARQGSTPVCLCAARYTGQACEIPIDCSMNNGGCDPLTLCTDSSQGVVCGACPAGYSGTGESGCVLGDACDGVVCEHGGRCLRGTTDFACLCPPGITGKHCELTTTTLASNGFCGILSDGSLSCWGNVSEDLPDGTFTAVSVGGSSCALRPSGALACWGNPNFVTPNGTFSAVAAGNDHNCAIGSDGNVQCWGIDSPASPSGTFSAVAVGTEDCGIRDDGSLACWNPAPFVDDPASLPPPSGTFTALAGGGYGLCAIDTARRVRCWGSKLAVATPPPAGEVEAVAVGLDYACAIRSNGTLACWGGGVMGRVPPPVGVFSALSTADAACALRDDERIVCWAPNDTVMGQLNPPNGDFGGVANPCTDVSCDGGSCQLDAALHCRCGDGMRRVSDDPLRCDVHPCWQNNGGCDPLTWCAATDAGASCGPCPDGYTGDGVLGCTPPSSPCAGVTCNGHGTCVSDADDYACICVPGRSGKNCELTFSSLSGLYKDACGVRSDGSLSCWLGDFFALTPPAGTFSQVSVGLGFACALDTTGHAHCFGKEGNPDPADDVFTSLFTSSIVRCGLRADGSVNCWQGSLNVPAGAFQALASSTTEVCGLLQDGTISCWTYGGEPLQAYQTPPPGQFQKLVGFEGHTCALRDDGAILCWGFSSYAPPSAYVDLAVNSDTVCGVNVDGTLECVDSTSTSSPLPGTFKRVVMISNDICGVRTDDVVVCLDRNRARAYPVNGDFSNIFGACNSLTCAHGTCSDAWGVACNCDSGYVRSWDDVTSCVLNP